MAAGSESPEAYFSGTLKGSNDENDVGAFFSVLLGLGVELDQPLADGQDGGLRAVIDL